LILNLNLNLNLSLYNLSLRLSLTGRAMLLHGAVLPEYDVCLSVRPV